MFKRLIDLPKRCIQYAHRFGIVAGPYVLFKMVMRQALFKTIARQGLVSVKPPECEHAIALRTGTTDIATFEQVFIAREYDLSLHSRDPKFIIDGGANVGCASVFFAQRYPNAAVYAIEPENSNYKVLARNAKHYRNITPIEAAIWNEDTFVEIANPLDEKWSFRVQSSSRNSSSCVRAVTIASLMDEAGVDRVDILKLDIEGAEIDVFDAKCKEWIDRIDVIVIELHDWIRPGCSSSLLKATEGHRYVQFRKGENTVLIKTERR